MAPEHTTARSRPDQPAQGAPAATDGDRLARLLDTLIEEAPLLVRHRALLAAADWRQATATQLERLRARLAGAGIKLPGWLARTLILSGHHLDVDTLDHLAEPALRLLSALNGLTAGKPLPDPLHHSLRDHAAGGGMEPETATAITARLVALGETTLACNLTLAHLPDAAQALRLVRAPLASETAKMPRLRVRLCGFSTTQLFADALKPAFAAIGRNAEVDKADFGTVVTELLSPSAEADALFVLLDHEGFLGNDWRNDLETGQALVDRKCAVLVDALKSYAGRHGAPLLINTLSIGAAPALGHIDHIHAAGTAATVWRVNQALAAAAAAIPSMHLVDTELALAAIPPKLRSDPKFWYYGRIPFTDAATRAIAHAYAVAWNARERGPVKVVALDFDNTLWGGVYGDDGLANLACGDDFPGNAFKAFQQECLRLKAQGLLLVGLSKNNADAISVLSQHPGMALGPQDFAATAINWEPKPDNIRRLARELNLGLSSFVFLDDSPHEREAMRRMCPEVVVPEMPSDPALRPLWLRGLTCTWPLRLTAEDAKRSQMYVTERKARELRESAASYDDYLRELGQELTIEPLSAGTLPRVAQLHERTNQFNLTTRRFSEAELNTFMAAEDRALVLLGTASDTFGNHGIVIAAVATIEGTTARIESFLMSCRVIARQIETAFLGALTEGLLARGVETIEGTYLPTPKNDMVRAFYPTHGFAALPPEPEGKGDRWTWKKGVQHVPSSPFVRTQWRPA